MIRNAVTRGPNYLPSTRQQDRSSSWSASTPSWSSMFDEEYAWQPDITDLSDSRITWDKVSGHSPTLSARSGHLDLPFAMAEPSRVCSSSPLSYSKGFLEISFSLNFPFLWTSLSVIARVVVVYNIYKLPDHKHISLTTWWTLRTYFFDRNKENYFSWPRSNHYKGSSFLAWMQQSVNNFWKTLVQF